MNNKYGCGCDQGFVPVSGNWDFNMDACQPRRRNTCEVETTCKRAVREDICPVCGKARNACTCGRKDYDKADVCSVCGRPRNACTCGRNNCARADVCSVCGRPRNACICGRKDCDKADVCPVCGRARNACICGRNNCARADYDACQAENNTPACVMKKTEPACGGAKKGVGIVRVTKQALNDIYDNGRALKAGTLFPELHKPMNGYWPCDNECGDGCQQAAFAAWEVRLYLDTHPDDDQARALLQQLIGDCCEPNYATTFLPENCSRWAWTDDPWPWKIEANCRK